MMKMLYNPQSRSEYNFVPGVIGLIQLAGFLPALNIVGEKEKGTIEQINVTPVGKFDFILSKLIPYWAGNKPALPAFLATELFEQFGRKNVVLF